MATVKSKTSIKIDELIDATVVSGTVDTSGHLILVTEGGALIDAGYIGRAFVGKWSSAAVYINGATVGYAGQTWMALLDNTNKPPALYTSIWQRLTGESLEDWVECDPYFSGDDLNADWDYSTKTGSPTVSYTSIIGEYETGTRGLKVNCPISSSQTIYAKEENIVRSGEIITVTVRARLDSAIAGARINAVMILNDTENPVPGAPGIVTVSSAEGAVGLTTAWADYTFTVAATGPKSRAIVNVTVSTDSSGVAVFFIDRIRIVRFRAMGSGAGGSEIEVGSVPPTVTTGLPELWVDTGTSVSLIPPVWTDITPLNGWENYPPSTVYTAMGCWRDIAGVVHLRGLLRNGPVVQNTVLGKLPVGFRPARECHISCASSGQFAVVGVAPNGDILFKFGTNAWYSIDGVSFPAEV